MNNRPDKAKLLAESLRDAARKAEEERAHNAQVARITAAVRAKLAPLVAETAQQKCPHCGEILPEGWRTDPVTSGTDNEDEDNVGDRPAEYDNSKLTPLQRAPKSKGIDPFKED